MKKCFNNVQMFKSSEVCNKFSKSVSYETLVIGATTIGWDNEQNQRLFLSSADKPLSAVGTLTSLLCNSAKVKALSFLRLRGASGAQGISTSVSCREAHKRRFLFNSKIPGIFRLTAKNRDDRFCFGFAKVTALALILTLATTSESSAETWDCGEIANTVSCSLDENGVFTISGTGKMKDYWRSSGRNGWVDERPWGSIEIANGEFTNIQTVVVGKGVTYIGSNAFEGFSCIKELKGMDDVEVIGGDAFYGTDLDDVNIPKAKAVGNYAFAGNSRLKNINMPNVEVFYGASFGSTPIRGYSGDCLQYKSGSCIRNDKWRCLSGYLLKENICIDSSNGCGAGYKDMGGWCNRIRYTPAEAAKVLRNDNTNEVTITFRK